ncbi:MAG TPA: Spy/CpxP family protein refolding chaperone [Stellaceae bacterium]
MPSLRILGAAALAATLASALAQGQSPPVAPIPAPAPAAPAASGPAPALSPEARAEVDARITKLQAELGITQAQLPLWSAFAQAMRDNAASTDALFTRRAGAVAKMSAVENMHSYAEIARAYADNTERLATAFDSLYASLSPTQKAAADTLFRQQAVAAAKPQSHR